MTNESLVVSKFGGTSMMDAECITRSAKICFKQKSKVIVVSATSKTTNDLIELSTIAQNNSWENAQVVLDKITSRHLKIAEDLKVTADKKQDLEALFSELQTMSKGINLLRDCSLKAFDKMQSFGERMSSILMTQAMENVLAENKSSKTAVKFLDARNIIKTDNQFSKARVDIEHSKMCAKETLSTLKHADTIYVTQGFIGSTPDGQTTTLGRGGSDYSAALFAEVTGADILEIWTDVAGIATTDPRITKNAKVIPEISFKEASELATFGAKILHPSTLMPAMRAQIPVFVGSSFDYEAGGTWIKKEVTNSPLIRAMAMRTNQVLITLSTPEMLYTHGFLYQIFKLFNDHKVSVDAITTSEISVSMTLEESALKNKELFIELEKLANVTIEENLTLVSLIGNNINHTSGLGKKIFSAIEGINVRMICLGASKHNFCFIVDGKEGPECITQLHKLFIE